MLRINPICITTIARLEERLQQVPEWVVQDPSNRRDDTPVFFSTFEDADCFSMHSMTTQLLVKTFLATEGVSEVVVYNVSTLLGFLDHSRCIVSITLDTDTFHINVSVINDIETNKSTIYFGTESDENYLPDVFDMHNVQEVFRYKLEKPVSGIKLTELFDARKKARQQACLTFMMSTHSRLGAESVIQKLAREIPQMICLTFGLYFDLEDYAQTKDEQAKLWTKLKDILPVTASVEPVCEPPVCEPPVCEPPVCEPVEQSP